MKLNDLKFLKLLPVFMRKDKDVIALSQAMDNALRDTNDHLKTASGWNAFDKLTETELDEMAWEFDVDWYDYGANREVKAAQIKSAQLIKQRRGTTWAVAQVVSDVFGTAYVKEWPEFNGNPFEFEVVTTNPNVTQEMYDRMMLLIEKVKNIRSILKRISYSHEVLSQIEVASQVHNGPFTLPICGVAWCGDYRLFSLSSNEPVLVGLEGVDQTIGTFTIPICSHGDTLLNLAPSQALSMTIESKKKTNCFAVPICGVMTFSAPVCGSVVCGQEKGGKK